MSLYLRVTQSLGRKEDPTLNPVEKALTRKLAMFVRFMVENANGNVEFDAYLLLTCHYCFISIFNGKYDENFEPTSIVSISTYLTICMYDFLPQTDSNVPEVFTP